MTNYAQPRVERNGCAMGNAARYAKFGSDLVEFGAKTPRHVNLSLV
jgi:hypothetical protein